MNQELLDWSSRAASVLEEIMKEVQLSSGETAGSDVAQLLAEYEDIKAGRPIWRARLSGIKGDQQTKEFFDSL